MTHTCVCFSTHTQAQGREFAAVCVKCLRDILHRLDDLEARADLVDEWRFNQ